MLLFIIVGLVKCQFGQDDADYYNTYTPDEIATTDESTTTTTNSNLQKYVPLADAKTCVTTYCDEEIVACKHNEDCYGNYGRFLVCYNQTQVYKTCKSALQNSTVTTQTFEFNDLMECYGLCGWSKTQPKYDYLILLLLGLQFLFC